MKEIHDDDVNNVLKDDGVNNVILTKYENLPTVNLNELKSNFGEDDSWAVRVIYNELFGGVLIRQFPEEGNREHYHSDADESWIILEGEWEWYIDGVGTKRVAQHDIIVVKKGIKHKIKCVGDKPGIRLAITRPDVDHIYTEE
jgi:quercetin dioxygenase-like cupin family protein